MKHKSSRMVALTLLYLFIIFGIFIIQFTVGKTFSYKIESMSISGRHTVDKNGKTEPLLPLNIVSNGLNFFVSEQTPVLAETFEKEQIPLKVLSYEKSDERFSISCTKGVRLNFYASKNGKIDTLQITVQMPEDIANIYIPWKLTPLARLERTEKQIFLRYGKNRFAFRGGHGFENYSDSTTPDTPYLILSKNSPLAFYETFTKSQMLSFESIPQNQLASNEFFIQTLKNYKEKSSHYFENEIASKNYSEDLATAFLAEQASQDKLERALRLAPLTRLSKQQRSYKSCPFYNNLAENNSKLLSFDSKKMKNISKLISEKDLQIFNQYQLMPFLIDNYKMNLFPVLEKLVDSSEPEILTASICGGILELYMDYSRFFPNKKNNLEESIEKCEKKITDSLLFIDNGLYVSSDGEKIDTAKTLELAQILIRYGREVIDKEIWRSVGQMLFSSILNFSGESASMPGFFNILSEDENKLGLMADDSLILRPEQLYPLVVKDNPNYPHRESFASQGATGTWAWTSADKIEIVENTAKILRFKVTFKQDEGHHLIIRGVKPFYRVNIYGLNYKSDPRFEIYKSSGYIYDYNTKTLLLKIWHKQPTEEITLFLGAPARPKPEVPAKPEGENTEEKKSEEDGGEKTEGEAKSENS